MPDATRTVERIPVEVLARELVGITRIGLRPIELAKRRADFPEAARLNRAGGTEATDDAWAEALVRLIEQAGRSVPSADLAGMTREILGLEMRYRGDSYERRRGRAVAIWDPELRKRAENFARRALPRIMRALAAEVYVIENSPTGKSGGIQLGTASVADQGRQPGLVRLRFRAETWLAGRGQRPYQSEWVYRDRARRAGINSIQIERNSKFDAQLEPITDSISSLDYKGTDVYGFKIWTAWLDHALEEGEPVEWGTRTLYGSAHLDGVSETEQLAQTVSHLPGYPPMEHGTFIANFDTRFLPTRVVRFITPKGTLPDLVGPVIEDIPIDRHGVARTEFDNLEAWMTYGINWWPQQPAS